MKTSLKTSAIGSELIIRSEAQRGASSGNENHEPCERPHAFCTCALGAHGARTPSMCRTHESEQDTAPEPTEPKSQFRRQSVYENTIQGDTRYRQVTRGQGGKGAECRRAKACMKGRASHAGPWREGVLSRTNKCKGPEAPRPLSRGQP